MLDTMTLTKIVGAFCGALLIFLLGKWVAEITYDTSGGHGHGGDHAQQGYVIEVASSDDAGASEEDGPSFVELFVAADAGKGERVFNKCKACHKLEEGANSTGPYLYGVVGRDVSSASGFGYSGSLKPVAAVWTPQELDAFLENPSGYAPGTTMAFSGLKKAEDRANVIAYLDQTDGDTYVIEEASAPAADDATEEAAAPAEDATEEAAAAVEEATEEAAAAVEEAAEDTAAAAEEATEEVAEAAEEATEEVAEAAEGATEEVAEATEEATEEVVAAADTAAAAVTEEAAAAEEAATEAVQETAAASESGFAALVAAADAAAGEKVFRKCAACHALEAGKNRVGPTLHNIVGAGQGAVEGFKYSNALADLGGTWTVDELNAFLTKPKDYAPGTKMAFPGLKKEDERANLIAYLSSASE